MYAANAPDQCTVGFLSNLFYDLRRNASDERVGRNILIYHGPCGHDHAFTNRHAGKNLNARTKPYVVADSDGPRVL